VRPIHARTEQHWGTKMAITPVKTLVAEAKQQIETLSPAAAVTAVAQGTALLVDLRDPRELAREGRIPGAFHAPRGMIEFWIDPQSPYFKPALATGQKLIFFCASGWRSALTVKALTDMGVQNIAEIDGGFTEWRNQGQALEMPEPKSS